MADVVASVTLSPRVTAKTIPASSITAAPSLTHQRELLKRADTIGDDTCGWVNGDLIPEQTQGLTLVSTSSTDTPLVCDYPYYQPCLWSPELHAVGCCGGAETTDCAWATSCVPYAMVNNGCDSACQANYMNTVCNEGYPLCATATFGGPAGYTYLSCTDTIGPTDTMMLTYYGGSASSIVGLPRYFSDYWFSSTATGSPTSTSTSSSSSSDAGVDHTLSWFSAHRTIVIAAIAGFCALVFLLLVGCCCYRRKRANRIIYRPASEIAAPVYSVQAPSQETYPMMQYQGHGGYGNQGQDYGQDYGRVYVTPNK